MGVAESDYRIPGVIRALSGAPVTTQMAASSIGRGSGVYAWWARPSVFPDLPGMDNEADPDVRLLYVGRATSLRGRILRTDLRRSGNSVLRRTLAGLLMPSEHYRTEWKDGTVLVPADERRLSAWMATNLRLTWAEVGWPEEIEDELLWRLVPPLNIHGMDPDDIQDAVVAAKDAFESSSHPSDSER